MVGGEVIETPSAAYKTAVINQYTNRPLKFSFKDQTFSHSKDAIIIPKTINIVNDIFDISKIFGTSNASRTHLTSMKSLCPSR